MIINQGGKEPSIEQLIKKMNKDLDAVIVEGKRDREALLKMGFEKEIISCSQATAEETIERALNFKAVAVLTDFDRHGRKAFAEITEGLERRGVKLKNIYRKKIKDILDIKNMKTIEALDDF